MPTTYKYGAEWDWENSIRKKEIEAKVDELPITVYMIILDEDKSYKAYSKVINNCRPTKSYPQWNYAFELQPGENFKLSESNNVLVGSKVSHTSSTEKVTQLNIKGTAGFEFDIISASVEGSSERKYAQEESSTFENSQVVENSSSLTTTYTNRKVDEKQIYWQLVYVIEYKDGVKVESGTEIFDSVFQPMEYSGVSKTPYQTAATKWKTLKSH